MKTLKIPHSDDFDFCFFLAKPEDVRDWNIQGLPADAFSTENGKLPLNLNDLTLTLALAPATALTLTLTPNP